MFNIIKIFQCPLCRIKLTAKLSCPKCNVKYLYQNGVYILINEKLSAREWKWDPDLFTENSMRQSRAEYQSCLNKETINAQKLWWKEMAKHCSGLHGIVCDLATGLGSLLEGLVKLKRKLTIIAADVDPNVLAWTINKIKISLSKQARLNLFTVASDAKHFGFCDEVVDFFVSCEGLNNIPDLPGVLKELYRTLKPGGRLIMMHTFVNLNSKSFKLAKGYNLEKALLERSLKADLANANFHRVYIRKVASAVWAKNPMDMIPVAGDVQHFAIVTAEKK
jgi:ubiquinone/menaquinone biosynthesis C-methylase UbiE